MRLIDADAYIDEINKRIKEAYGWYDEVSTDEMKVRAEQAIATFCEASLTAKKMPSAEKTGEWIPYRISDDEDLGVFSVVCNQCKKPQFYGTNYCPNCGAKMEV